MQQKLKRVLSCIILVCLVGMSMNYLIKLMERKDSISKYTDFFSQKEDFDVLFMGSSHVVNGVFPMELWNDYGIVSYNMGGHANQMATTYWVMKNTLDYTTPKLMVIDGAHLEFNIKTGYSFSNIHMSFDAFPLSRNKIAAIRDLLDDEGIAQKAEQGDVSDLDQRTESSILWNYSVYHSRWTELEHGDFYPELSKEKGAESRIAVAAPREIRPVPPDSLMEEDTLGVQYLCKMIDECQKQGIEVLLVYLPFPPQEQDFQNANRMYRIAEEYGVNYINFLDMNIVDYSTDCYDEGSHLNPSGARKVTSYLGQYIMAHYEIPDQRMNDAYADWYDSYEEYRDFKTDKLLEQQELDCYLMLLADKSLDVMIELYDPSVWGDARYCSLFRNLGIDLAKLTPQTDVLIIEQGGRSVSYLENSRNMAAETPENVCVHLTVRDSITWESMDDVYFTVRTEGDAAGNIVQKIQAVR